MVNYAYTWAELAEAWVVMFNDKKEARKCLDNAEAIADTSDDWMYMTRTWKLLGNRRKALYCEAMEEKKRPEEYEEYVNTNSSYGGAKI